MPSVPMEKSFILACWVPYELSITHFGQYPLGRFENGYTGV